jgi:hypothetical protein
MATTKLRSVDIGSVLIQSGFGNPNHISTIGSIYVDLNTALVYVNQNGISTWSSIGSGGGIGNVIAVYPGVNVSTGGTVTEPIINVVDSPNFNNLTVTGDTILNNLNVNNLSGDTILISGQTLENYILNLVSGNTNFYTTGATLVDDTIYFDRNDSLSAYSVNLSGITVSGTVNTYVTGGTLNNGILDLIRNDNVTLSISGFSDTIVFGGSRNRPNQSNLFLRRYDGMPYNLNPYYVYQDSVITNVVASSSALDTWEAHILTGTNITIDSIYNLKLTNQNYNSDNLVNIDVPINTPLYLYMSGTNVSHANMDVYIKKK